MMKTAIAVVAFIGIGVGLSLLGCAVHAKLLGLPFMRLIARRDDKPSSWAAVEQTVRHTKILAKAGIVLLAIGVAALLLRLVVENIG